MSRSIGIRAATEVDLQTMVEIGAAAFGRSPASVALFPERLRIKPGMQDENDFRVSRWKKNILEPQNHFIVAVEDQPDGSEAIAGFATWGSPSAHEPTDEEKAAKKKELEDSLPPSLDKEALGELRKASAEWEKSIMGEDGTKDYWILQAIAVDPNHQRKGVGRLLVQWGLDQAAKEGRSVWLIASPQGRELYTAMGFEIIAERDELGELQTCMWKKRNENAV